MAAETRNFDDVTLLPGWQRLAWIAAVWSGSVSIMVLITWLIAALFG
ncbi:hypothetical protein [Qipengyuania sp.]